MTHDDEKGDTLPDGRQWFNNWVGRCYRLTDATGRIVGRVEESAGEFEASAEGKSIGHYLTLANAQVAVQEATRPTQTAIIP